MPEKIALAGLLPQEICSVLQISPTFRGKQIFKWIGEGAVSFDQMTNLPSEMRRMLSEKAVLRSACVEKILTDSDGTVKLQLCLHDGRFIETVLLIDAAKRKTACVSCQTGCAMRCAFCQTGQLGAGRNLSASEIAEEFFCMEEAAGHLDNIVFMGMGEPMLNLKAIQQAIAVLTSPDGRGLSSRRITISTSGVISGIYEMADSGPHVRLAVSLTTADPELRSQLMPVTKNNPLPELRKAIAYFIEKTGKRCTLEAALFAGVNTSDEKIRQLIDFARGLDVHINLIPWNPVGGLPFKTPSRRECETVLKQLEQAGINATLRVRRGEKIGGACGQLGKIN